MELDPDDITRLRLAVLRMARRLRQQGRGDITPSQLSALSTIDRAGPLSLGELASAENVAPPTISRIVGALEGEDYVTRTIDETDRRSALVGITAKGHGLLEDIRSERNAWLSQRLRTLTSEQRASLGEAVDVLEHLLEHER